MILPNSKKYLLYIKTAKTAGTSFLKYLEQVKPVKKYKRLNNERVLDDVEYGDIIVVPNDIVELFKVNYREVFENSYKVILSRNPYSKIISCFNYHRMVKNNSLYDLLINTKYMSFDSTKIDYKLESRKSKWKYYSFFTHFYLPQTFGLIENEKIIVDEIIPFENLEEGINKLFNKINITNDIGLQHLNKTRRERVVNLDRKILDLINQRFADDFKYLRYDLK